MFSNRFPETATAIAYETQGFFEQAQSAYELVSWNRLLTLKIEYRLSLRLYLIVNSFFSFFCLLGNDKGPWWAH